MCFTIEKKSRRQFQLNWQKNTFFFVSSFHTLGFASWWAYGAVSSSECGLTWLGLWSIILGCTKLDVQCDNQRTKHFIIFLQIRGARSRKQVPKLDFQSVFLCQKSSKSFYFLMKNKSFGAHLLLKCFFGKFNFKTTLLLKSCLIFDQA